MAEDVHVPNAICSRCLAEDVLVPNTICLRCLAKDVHVPNAICLRCLAEDVHVPTQYVYDVWQRMSMYLRNMFTKYTVPSYLDS